MRRLRVAPVPASAIIIATRRAFSHVVISKPQTKHEKPHPRLSKSTSFRILPRHFRDDVRPTEYPYVPPLLDRSSIPLGTRLYPFRIRIGVVSNDFEPCRSIFATRDNFFPPFFFFLPGAPSVQGKKNYDYGPGGTIYVDTDHEV